MYGGSAWAGAGAGLVNLMSRKQQQRGAKRCPLSETLAPGVHGAERRDALSIKASAHLAEARAAPCCCVLRVTPASTSL